MKTEAGIRGLTALRATVQEIAVENSKIQERQNASISERNSIWESLRDMQDAIDKLFAMIEEGVYYRDMRTTMMCEACPKYAEAIARTEAKLLTK